MGALVDASHTVLSGGVLNHAPPSPQGNAGIRPAPARRLIGGHGEQEILDARDVVCRAIVGAPPLNTVCEASTRAPISASLQ